VTRFDPDAVFAALADPTRREVLTRLLDAGPTSASALAPGFDVSRQAVVKHLGVLEEAGLVKPERVGREVRYEVQTAPLAEAAEWLARTGAAWDRRLARLARRTARG
jgi:DNA-binding transcriptional ArsR family regulator